MKYIWILYDKMDLVISVFSNPEHAFTSMERLYGRGLVSVLSRSAISWQITVKSNGVLVCRRHKVRDKPMSL